MPVRWLKFGRRFVTTLQTVERTHVYGFQINQVVLFAAIWITACASACARSAATRSNRRRRSLCDHIAYGCTAGFASLCILGIVSLAVGAEYFDSRAIAWVCVSAGIGALGEEQHAIMRSMLLGVLETLTKKKDDDPK